MNASSRTSRCATHDSGPVWFAIPSLLETFTLYSLSISRRTSVLYFSFFVPSKEKLGLNKTRLTVGTPGKALVKWQTVPK